MAVHGSSARLLVVAPHAPSSSELWMTRMIGYLGDQAAGFAAFGADPPESTEWFPLAPDLPAQLNRFGVAERCSRLGSAALQRAIDEVKPDLVFCNYINVAVHFRTLVLGGGTPWLIHAHGYDIPWDTGGDRSMRALRTRRYARHVSAIGRIATIIANSRRTATALESAGVPADRIAIKRFGVPRTGASPIGRADGTPLQILYLGRLVDFKGPIETIQAFGRFRELGGTGHLTLAGDGPLHRECTRTVQDLGLHDTVSIVGAVSPSEGERLRSEAHVFSLHSGRSSSNGQEEAFGVAILEAMEAGLPVVSTTSGSIPELVADGDEGLLVEPGDIEEHARSLLTLFRHETLRSQLGRAGRAKAHSSFGLDHERRELEEAIGAAMSAW